MKHYVALTGIRTHASEEIQKCILAVGPLGHHALLRFNWDSNPQKKYKKNTIYFKLGYISSMYLH